MLISAEDAHWCWMQQEYERSKVPLPESECLFLKDEEVRSIEEEYGCKMEDLDRYDLMDIVSEKKGVYATSVVYDPEYCSIDYEYYS